MKAITVCQPYASLIMMGDKRVENRRWSTHYRGDLIIHAGKSLKWMPTRYEMKLNPRLEVSKDVLPFGKILGIVTLVDVVHFPPPEYRQDLSWLKSYEHASGPWCWILENPRPFKVPIPWRGAQGLFTIDPRAMEIRRQNMETCPQWP